ncbi:hypothetical protein ACJMK2_019865 [Sinanodonta woodiana]|uniref:Transmembrane protein 183 n=1 Tax=Sinanodonta woodiana TaxID=1069815 RepID=A0ABD3TZG3_SINWO
MPRGHRKMKQQAFDFGDVTVHEYADALPSNKPLTARVKKGSTIKKEVKTRILKKNMDELHWYEKDLEDFDIVPDEEDLSDTELKDDGNSHKIHTKKDAEKKKLKLDRHASAGVVYPVDIWFLLARYIYPEDIQSFACLCKGAYSVVRCVQFWKQLYLRWYNKQSELPVSLHPYNLDCVHGLQARVIRSLFYMYRPFADHLKSVIPFQSEPDQLIGQTCLRIWHDKYSWNFKFTKSSRTVSYSNIPRGICSSGFDSWHKDLFYNQENNCCILQVTSKEYQSIPIVMGLVLNKISLSVSRDMRHHRLRMVFDSVMKLVSKDQSQSIEVILDPVVNLKILHWWDPKYINS